MTDTQIEAHTAIKPVKVTLQDIVLETIRGFGPIGAISDDVVYAMNSLQYGQSSITTRFKELAEKGKIVYQTTPRRNAKGRNQRVMVATEFVPQVANGY